MLLATRPPVYFFVALVALLPQTPTVAQEKTEAVKPVRMGCGLMTFETVPGWGLRPDGNSPLGATHGSVVIDKAGHIYTSTEQGVFAFTPDGIIVKSYLGPKYSSLHDMEI